MDAWTRAAPRLIAHRGASDECTENTLPAFLRAAEVGAHAVELDVRLSADGELVVHHDHDWGRVVPLEGAVHETKWADVAASGAAVPRLGDVLAALPPNIGIDIEVKADDDSCMTIPPILAAALRGHDARPIIITSFAPDLALEAARAARRPAGAILPFAPDMSDLEDLAGVDAIMLHHEACTPEALDSARRVELAVYVWTVNDEAVMARVAADHVAGIITDCPATIGPRWADVSDPAPRAT